MDIAKKQLILKTVLGVLLGVAAVSLVGIIVTANKYAKGKQEYAKLEGYVSIEAEKAPVVEPEKEVEEAEVEEVSEEQEEVVRMINVDFDMDYAALKAINSDLVGWIYYEGLDLSYPVVMDRGDDYYEHHTFEKKSNGAGAIFMDFLCKSDFTSFNSIIYGHNMRNDTMFGALNNAIDNQKIIEENPYFYVFTENEALMYRIVSAYYTKNNSNTYNINLDYELYDMQDYVDYMDSVSLYRDDEFFGEEVTEDTKLCTLSTCHGLHSTSRTVIHGVLVAREPR